MFLREDPHRLLGDESNNKGEQGIFVSMGSSKLSLHMLPIVLMSILAYGTRMF